jgi:hypothetical protein
MGTMQMQQPQEQQLQQQVIQVTAMLICIK